MSSTKQLKTESSDSPTTAPNPDPSTKEGPPVKPNYDEFKEALAKATKNLEDAKARVVSAYVFYILSPQL